MTWPRGSGAEHWTLRDTTGDIVCQGFSLSQGNILNYENQL